MWGIWLNLRPKSPLFLWFDLVMAWVLCTTGEYAPVHLRSLPAINAILSYQIIYARSCLP